MILKSLQNTPSKLQTPGEGGLGCTTFVVGSHESDGWALGPVVTVCMYFLESGQRGKVLWSLGYLTSAFHELAKFPKII